MTRFLPVAALAILLGIAGSANAQVFRPRGKTAAGAKAPATIASAKKTTPEKAATPVVAKKATAPTRTAQTAKKTRAEQPETKKKKTQDFKIVDDDEDGKDRVKITDD